MSNIQHGKYLNMSAKFALDVAPYITPFMHEHDYIEIGYVSDGMAMHFVNDDIQQLIMKGDYFIIDYGSSHRYEAVGDGTFEVTNCMFKPEYIDSMLTGIRSFDAIIGVGMIRFDKRALLANPTKTTFHDDDGEIYEILSHIKAENIAKNVGYKEVIRSELVKLIIKTLRKISVAAAKYLQNNHGEFLVEYVTGYVDTHYMKKISLTELSEELNYSVPYLSKRIKDETGKNFSELVLYRRCAKAQTLLSHTKKKINEIAKMVGFADTKVFNRKFKERVGYTPSDFRKLTSQEFYIEENKKAETTP